MKVILIFPKNYSLLNIFEEGFRANGCSVKNIDYYDFLPDYYDKRQLIVSKLPYKYRQNFIKKDLIKINNKYLEIIKRENPDLILIYNEQKLIKETVSKFKKIAKVAFFLGDSPLFIQNRGANLGTILEGDYIFAPDSYWIEQMKIMGVKNISFLMPGYNNKLNYITKLTQEEKIKYTSDIVFVGRQYHDSWGYKRALFYSKFSDLNFKIYGNKTWYKWFDYFPELKNNFVLNRQYLPFQTVNKILNASKIYPVDANPGLINGLHIRIFDCIGSGILPVTEYRKDIDIVFSKLEIPVIRNYDEAKEIVEFYLKNDAKRMVIIKKLKTFVDENYTPESAAKLIINKIFN